MARRFGGVARLLHRELGLLARRDVLDHRAEQRLALPVERDDAHIGVEGAAVEAAEAPLVRLHALAAVGMAAHQLDGALAACATVGLQLGRQLGEPDDAAEQPTRIVGPEQAQRGRIAVRDAALAVEEQVAVGGVLEHRIEAQLGMAALRNVEPIAVVDGAAITLLQGCAVGQHPDRACAVPHQEFHRMRRRAV